MKFLLFSLITSLFLCFQSSLASIKEYKLNNIRVIICDDFFLPIAKVGVFYSVGLNQLKNICEAEIIEKIFFSETSKKSAKKLGTDVVFRIYDDFSEASAIVSNEQIPNIIKIILDNKNELSDFSLLKNKIKIKHKLSDYFQINFVNNEIYARIDPKYIFNESTLNYIAESDLKNSLNKYEKTHLNIIICGKLDEKQLIKKLHLQRSSPEDVNTYIANSSNAITSLNFSEQTVEARSKFLGRSLYYMYQTKNPDLKKKQNAIFAILSHEIFNYFKKYSLLIDNFLLTNLAKYDLFLLGFKLKADVSKKSFEINLKNFFSYIQKTKFSHKKLELISKLKKFSEINVGEDIHAKYQIIKNRYILPSKTQNPTSEEILNISSDDIRNFMEQVITNNFVAKISTQYKTEN